MKLTMKEKSTLHTYIQTYEEHYKIRKPEAKRHYYATELLYNAEVNANDLVKELGYIPPTGKSRFCAHQLYIILRNYALELDIDVFIPYVIDQIKQPMNPNPPNYDKAFNNRKDTCC